MPRICTICGHPDRAEIDRALVTGTEANRRIAARFQLSEQAIRRHRTDHLPAELTKAAAIEEEATATGLLARLRALNAETADVLKAARDAEDHELRLKAITRAEKQIELEGRLLGELQNGAPVNVVITPEWVAVRSVLLSALAPFPQAKIAVAEHLVALEAGRAG
jgi:hypothetical protein